MSESSPKKSPIKSNNPVSSSTTNSPTIHNHNLSPTHHINIVSSPNRNNISIPYNSIAATVHEETTIITRSANSLSSSSSVEEITTADLPGIGFAPSSNGLTANIDSPSRANRESQPLLGRLEADLTFNTFPGMFINVIIVRTYLNMYCM